MATWIKHARPGCRVIGCQPAASPVMYESVKAGRIVEYASDDSLADGSAGMFKHESVKHESVKHESVKHESVKHEPGAAKHERAGWKEWAAALRFCSLPLPPRLSTRAFLRICSLPLAPRVSNRAFLRICSLPLVPGVSNRAFLPHSSFTQHCRRYRGRVDHAGPVHAVHRRVGAGDRGRDRRGDAGHAGRTSQGHRGRGGRGARGALQDAGAVPRENGRGRPVREQRRHRHPYSRCTTIVLYNKRVWGEGGRDRGWVRSQS